KHTRSPERRYIASDCEPIKSPIQINFDLSPATPRSPTQRHPEGEPAAERATIDHSMISSARISSDRRSYTCNPRHGLDRLCPGDSRQRHAACNAKKQASRDHSLQTGSVRPQTTARTVAPFFVVTLWTQPFGR